MIPRPVHTVVTGSPRKAASFINRRGIVAFPTETVYGLGADITCDTAIQNIFRAKGRPSDNPLIVHIHSPGQAGEVAAEITPAARAFMDSFFPGPLTVIVKKHPNISRLVSAGLDTIGIRCPAHPLAHEFLSMCNHPVAAPSANISGRPSSTDWHTVYHDLRGKIDCILKGSESRIGVESTIVDCSGTIPLLLRAGAITLENLQRTEPSTTIAPQPDEHQQPRSPGLKYQHYAPSADIILFERDSLPDSISDSAACICLHDTPERFTKICRCRDLDDYAFNLFRFFRQCDNERIETIYCELPPDTGLGRALRDRLTRAAGHH